MESRRSSILSFGAPESIFRYKNEKPLKVRKKVCDRLLRDFPEKIPCIIEREGKMKQIKSLDNPR